MAMVAACDVFGTTKGVKRYRVTVWEIGPGPKEDLVSPPVLQVEPYLSPRALERLKKKIGQGVTPPAEKGKEESDTNGK